MRDSRKTRDFMNLVHTHGHDKTIKGMALSNKGKAHLFRLHFRMGQVPISWKMVNVEGKTQGSAPSSQCIEPLVLAGPEVSNQNHWNQVGPKCVHGLRRDITIDIQLSFAKSKVAFGLHLTFSVLPFFFSFWISASCTIYGTWTMH